LRIGNPLNIHVRENHEMANTNNLLRSVLVTLLLSSVIASITAATTVDFNRIQTEVTTELVPPGPITLGDRVVNRITITTTATGTLTDATGTWTVEASKDNTFMTGVESVDNGPVSGQLPFTIDTDNWTPPSAGTWYFRVKYSGNDNYENSESNPMDKQLVVNETPTSRQQ